MHNFFHIDHMVLPLHELAKFVYLTVICYKSPYYRFHIQTVSSFHVLVLYEFVKFLLLHFYNHNWNTHKAFFHDELHYNGFVTNVCRKRWNHMHFLSTCTDSYSFCLHYGNTGCGVFKPGGTKLERFLPKNQHTQRKLLNFENWISGGLRSFQKSEF